MTDANYTMEFDTDAEAYDFLDAVHYERFPGTAGYSHVQHGFDDFGNATITFARRMYNEVGETVVWYFAEMQKRRTH